MALVRRRPGGIHRGAKAAETTAAPESKAEESKAEETSAEAQGGEMSHDELVEAAKKEGKLVVYSTTSRVSTAAENFEKLYGIKVETANLKDGELVEKISLEVGGGVNGADMVLCQDGRQSLRRVNHSRIPGELRSRVPEGSDSRGEPESAGIPVCG